MILQLILLQPHKKWALQTRYLNITEALILTEDRTNQSQYPINSVEMTFLFCS